jgi:hypothetical protein
MVNTKNISTTFKHNKWLAAKETTHCEVAKFFVPDWEDIVDFGIGLSYRPARARLHRLACRYDKPMP